MIKIAFVQNSFMEYLGVMYLASFLKTHGHRVEVFIHTSLKRKIEAIKKYQPDLVGFSCTTGMHGVDLEIAKAIKSTLNTKTVFGGPHPTLSPEIIQEPQVDIVCMGEGEGALLDLVNALDRNLDVAHIPNLWIKKGNQIIKNELRPLIEDLDSLPFPDRSIYYAKYPFMDRSQKAFIAGRGCPYRCTYCFNDSLQRLYRDKGRYVRLRSVENVISEIKEAVKRYNLKTVYMLDDTFIINKPWLFAFLEAYRTEIKLPFICLVRADLITEEIVKRLKSANCYAVFIGVESGDERLRNLVLGKDITDQQIMETAALLKKNKIKFRAYNMFGIPGESLEEAFKTVELNIAIKTDYPWSSVLQPYPKFAIRGYAERQGMLKEEINFRYFFKDSALTFPHIKELVNLQKLFYWVVKFPFLKPLVRELIKLPPNPVFDILFSFGYAYSYYKSERLRFREVLRIGWSNIFSFMS